LQVFPHFDKLQHRTLYVTDSLGYEEHEVEPRLWVKEVVQPKDRHFVAVEGTSWDEDSKSITISYGDGCEVLLFQESETGQRFCVVLELLTGAHDDIESSTSDERDGDLIYVLWCTVIEPLPSDIELSLLIAIINDYHLKTIDKKYYELNPTDEQYTANLAIQNGHIVQATLALERFTERKEFSLTIRIKQVKEHVWSGLMKERVLLSHEDESAGKSEGRCVELGYMTTVTGGQPVPDD
jgi:hypothetical protein